MDNATRKPIQTALGHLGKALEAMFELDTLSFTNREFGEEIRVLLRNVEGTADSIISRARRESYNNDVELGLRFKERVRFYAAEAGSMNDSLNSKVGHAWLEPSYAFQEKIRMEASNASLVERKKAKARTYAVYGYTPKTGIFKKYETVEDARKDAFRE